MAFFTSQQLFGNGAGSPGDPGWVPIELAAPPTFSANNRGIAFGEQLTSAIANRPHYALALNDDDLNTRLALFETGGLDAAYDLGAAAVDGGGREITKDGGAVETISALASLYADDIANAHFRANALGDTAGGGGFDHRASRQTALPTYGYLARLNINAADQSTFGYSVSATMNPAGAGGDILRLTAATAYTGSNTDVSLGYDMVEITGAGALNGLYYLYQLGPTTADFLVRRFNATTPAFGSNTAVTVRFFRHTLMTPMVSLGGTFAASISAQSDDDLALAVMTHDVNGYLGTGPRTSIQFYTRTAVGGASAPAHFTGAGQYNATLSSALFGATHSNTEMRTYGGIRNIILDHSGASAGTHEAGILFKDLLDGSTSRAALENWQRITETSVLGIGASVNGTFAAPSGRVILQDSDGTPAPPTGLQKWTWALAVLPGITVIEMLTGAEAGRHYLLSYVELTGASIVDTVPDEIRLVDMDGNAAALPTAGTFTFRFIARDVFGYLMPEQELYDSPDSSWSANDTASYAHLLQAQRSNADLPRAVGIVGTMAGGIGLGGTGIAGDYHLQEQWTLDESGNFSTRGHIESATLSIVDASVIGIEQIDKVINIHLLTGQPETDSGGLTGWFWDQPNGWWEARVAGAVMYFPILFTGRLMETELQVFLANTGAHDIAAGLQSVEPDWGTPANAPTFVTSNTDTTNGSNAWRELSINHSLGVGTVVGLSTKSYAIRVEADDVGDRIRALRHTVRYVNIGPGGIGS